MDSDQTSHDNVLYIDDENVFRTGFEPSLDEIDEGIYNDEPPDSSNGRIDGQEDEDDRKCLKCLQCLQQTYHEVVSTTNEIAELIKNELKPSRPGCQYWILEFIHKRFPCLKWMSHYRLRHLKGDIVAGLTTGLSVLPQGLAYGQIVEIPAKYGLYSSIMGSYTYAILGGCKDIAVGPSAIVSIVTAQYGTGRSPVLKDPTYATILAFFSGFILMTLGVLRLGFLFSFISLPVLKAFRAAAGITIFMSRIKKWWGLLNVPREFLPQLYWTLKRISETNLYDLGVGSLSILLLFTFKKLKARKWKSSLSIFQKVIRIIFWILGAERNIIVVIICGSIVYALLNVNIPISHTDDIPRGVPWPQVPNFTLTYNNGTTERSFIDIASDIGVGFFFVPMISMFECISVGKAFARKGNYKFDYNKELIAIGVSNILTSLLRGHPITGAFLRSGINFNAGVQTPAGGILAATVVIASLYLAYPLFYYIPVCTMAATIMMGAIDVCTFHKFGIIWTTNKIEILPWLATFIISLTLGIEYGVFFGVAVHSIISLFHLVKPKFVNKTTLRDENEKILTIALAEKYSKFEFWSADHINAYLIDQIDLKDACLKTILIDLSVVLRLDTSIIQCFKILNERCNQHIIELKLINVHPSLETILGRTNLKFELNENFRPTDFRDETTTS